MLTYGLWKDTINEFDYYTSNFYKMGAYAMASFLSIPIIAIDILFSPFEIMGIIIWLITRRKK